MKSHVTITDLLIAGIAMNGELPGIFTQMYEAKRLTKREYKLLAQLWEQAIRSFQGGQQEIPLTSPLRLSTGMLNNQLSASATLSGAPVQVFEVIYPREWSMSSLGNIAQKIDRYIAESGIEATNLVYKTVRRPGRPKRIPIIGIKEQRGMRQPIVLKLRQHIALGLREPITGTRTPIYGERQPIITRKPVVVHGAKKPVSIRINAPKYDWLTDVQKAELLAIAHLGADVVKVKLNRFKQQASTRFTPDEMDCLEHFVPYYENLICSKTGQIEHHLIRGPYKKNTNNWKQVWKVYCLCKERGWDYKVYLDAQFESFDNWEASKKYRWPLPNMLYSERAIAAFEAYIYRNETVYQNEGHNIKATARNVGTFQEELEKKIQKALGIITKDLKHWERHPLKIFTTIPSKMLPGYNKAKAIMDNWMDNLPVEYLAAVPEILDFIGDKETYLPSIKAKIDEVEALQNNMAKMRLILPAVRRAEQAASVPRAANLLEVSKFINS